MIWKTIITCVFLIFLFFTKAEAGTVHLSVAASMTDAFREIVTAFSAAHPETDLRPNFASSGSLAKQIEQGAPADIFVSANPKWMHYLEEMGMIEPGTNRIFAHNKLVFIGDPGLEAHGLEDLAGLERIALGTPQSVPAGQYARQAMERAGIYHQLQQSKKLIMAKDVRQALIYADRGEAEGAFVYRTDALLARHAVILFTVPDTLYDRVAYPMALTVHGAQNDLARAFHAFLGSPEAIAVMERYGFESAR